MMKKTDFELYKKYIDPTLDNTVIDISNQKVTIQQDLIRKAVSKSNAIDASIFKIIVYINGQILMKHQNITINFTLDQNKKSRQWYIEQRNKDLNSFPATLNKSKKLTDTINGYSMTIIEWSKIGTMLKEVYDISLEDYLNTILYLFINNISNELNISLEPNIDLINYKVPTPEV